MAQRSCSLATRADRYVLPKIGGMPVDKVGSAALYGVLRPTTLAGKHATVKVAGAAIMAVLEWARTSEFALAHVEGSANVAAYARDDLLKKRCPFMQAWADRMSR